jgi:hypothetical protein
MAARLARREARKIAEADRAGTPGRIVALAAACRRAIQHFKGPRLLARRVNELHSLRDAAREAIRTGGVGYDAYDGGHVANSYGYRSETEWVESHAVVVHGTIRAIRRVGRSDAGQGARSIGTSLASSLPAAQVAARGARVGVVSPTVRRFMLLGVPHRTGPSPTPTPIPPAPSTSPASGGKPACGSPWIPRR